MEFHGKSERYISSLRASLLPDFRAVEVSEHLRSSTRSRAHIHLKHPFCRTVLPPGSPRTLTLTHSSYINQTSAAPKQNANPVQKGLQLGHLDRPHPSASPQLCMVLQDPRPYSGHFSPRTLPAFGVFYGGAGLPTPWAMVLPSLWGHEAAIHLVSLPTLIPLVISPATELNGAIRYRRTLAD